MTTIEDKIKLFSKIVSERIQAEKQAELDEFDSQKKDVIESKKHELEEKRNIVLKEASKKVQLKYNEIISREKLEKQSAVLELKKTFISDLTKEVRLRLGQYVKRDEYENFLVELIKETVSSIENGDYIIFISEEDKKNYTKRLEWELKAFENMNFTIKATDEDIVGGIIIQSVSGKFRIDASLASKLEEYREIIGVKISEKIG